MAALLIDREITDRDSRRLKTRHREARLKQSACMEDIDYRAPRSLDKSAMARIDVFIFDDWGLSKLTAEQRCDLLEILEDLHNACSTVVTIQIPIDRQQELIGDATSPWPMRYSTVWYTMLIKSN